MNVVYILSEWFLHTAKTLRLVGTLCLLDKAYLNIFCECFLLFLLFVVDFKL